MCGLSTKHVLSTVLYVGLVELYMCRFFVECAI